MGSRNSGRRSGAGKKGKSCHLERVVRAFGTYVEPVIVHWIDSCEPSPNAEVEKTDLPTPQDIWQCGLVHESDTHVVIAGGLKPEQETMDYVISIPKFAVQSISRCNYQT